MYVLFVDDGYIFCQSVIKSKAMPLIDLNLACFLNDTLVFIDEIFVAKTPPFAVIEFIIIKAFDLVRRFVSIPTSSVTFMYS